MKREHVLTASERIRGPHFQICQPKFYLEISRGRARHRMRPIHQQTYVAGRSSNCDLVLMDDQFEAVHFYLAIDGSQIRLRRCAMKPEVTVNGVAAFTQTLSHLDRITTGPFEFILHICHGGKRPVFVSEPRRGHKLHSLHS